MANTENTGEHPQLTPDDLKRQNAAFAHTCGVSANNSCKGFLPAFRDSVTGETHISVNADGNPAAVHLLDGVPDHWVIKRNGGGRVTGVIATVVAGFVRDGCFYTREELADTTDED